MAHTQESKRPEQAFKGWLVLYALRIVLLPFVFLFDLKSLGDAGSLGLSDLTAMVNLGYVADAVAIVAGAAGIYIFFTRRKHAITYFKAFEIYLAVYYAGFGLWIGTLLDQYGVAGPETYTRTLWSGCVLAIIWAAYWFKSRRVQATFVK